MRLLEEQTDLPDFVVTQLRAKRGHRAETYPVFYNPMGFANRIVGHAFCGRKQRRNVRVDPFGQAGSAVPKLPLAALAAFLLKMHAG